MPVYNFLCPKCGEIKEKKPCNMDLTKTRCPVCESIAKRIWKVPKDMNNFMPDIKGSSKVSKRIMKEEMAGSIYSSEPPSATFWHDVKSGKIEKRGNLYVRKSV